jgi:hypothetical protein
MRCDTRHHNARFSSSYSPLLRSIPVHLFVFISANFKDKLDNEEPVNLSREDLQQAKQLMNLNDRLMQLKTDPEHKASSLLIDSLNEAREVL